MKKIILASLFAAASQLAFAGGFNCIIKNIHQPANTNNVLEFDVYLKSTSKEQMKFQAFQGGIQFNYDQLANGGVITGQYVKNSADPQLTGLQVNPNWNVNPGTKQIRLLAAIQPTANLAKVIPTEGMKLGTFRLTNTVAFGTTTPDLTWSFNNASSKTKSAVTVFQNGKNTGEAISTQTTFSFEKQGPEFFVESNPVINAKPTTTGATLVVDNISVYPNPVHETLKLDITSNGNETVIAKLIDNNGRVVKQVQQEMTTGKSTINMEVKDLSAGSYFLQVYRKDENVFNKQIIKN